MINVSAIVGIWTDAAFLPRRSLILVPTLLLAACAAPLDARLSAAPSVPARAPIAEAQPVAPTGNLALDAFLAEVAAAIDRQDWRGLAFRFEPGAFAEQADMVGTSGRPARLVSAQVIAETLGLSRLFDYDAPASADPFAGLARIRVVTLRSIDDTRPHGTTVRGDVRIDDGSTLPISFLVGSAASGYHIVVPRG